MRSNLRNKPPLGFRIRSQLHEWLLDNKLPTRSFSTNCDIDPIGWIKHLLEWDKELQAIKAYSEELTPEQRLWLQNYLSGLESE